MGGDGWAGALNTFRPPFLKVSDLLSMWDSWAGALNTIRPPFLKVSDL
jgi:hypothetical protein